MDKKREAVVAEVLSAIKAEEVLERLMEYLDKSSDMIMKQDLMAIIQKGEEADEYYS